MGLQFDETLRNTWLDAIEARIGAGATLEIRTGSPPANAAAADSGSVLATVNLPTDLFSTAAAGQITLSGTWEDTSADAAGTADHFRIKQSGGTCIMQGTVGTGSEDLVLDNDNFAVGQAFNVSTFTISAPGG